jgi:FADH2 O2-dependent halogenase
MNEFCADVAILGAGFGGTITALMLERMGLRPVVLDRASHPRFAIGESSTPTGNIILRALADRYDRPRLRPLAAHGPWQDAYPDVTGGRKRGFSYFRHRRGEPFAPDPIHANELLVAASSDPYHSDTQWLRADVDAFLANEVRDADIPLLENTTITNVDGRPPWTVRAQREGKAVQCTTNFIADATGGSQLLPALGFAESEASLRTRSRALYAHFDGLPRWRDWLADHGARTADHPYPCDDAVVHHVLDDGWMWEIRFDDGRVSAGLVLDAETHPPTKQSPLDEWRTHLDPYPTLARRFENANLVDPPGKIVQTGHLQRLVDRAAGPGWALLPSTAGFVDPLHSTGIAHTLSGVERLCRLFERHGASPSPSALQEYDHTIRRELRFVDELVRLCYDALPSFRAWTASTMLYFAAATTYERRRADADDIPDDPPAFLCADEEELWTAVRRARRTVPPDDEPSSGTLDTYESTVEDAIRPFNEVGLFDPSVPNMYPHTAAPET